MTASRLPDDTRKEAEKAAKKAGGAVSGTAKKPGRRLPKRPRKSLAADRESNTMTCKPSLRCILAFAAICAIPFLLCGAFAPSVLLDVRTRRVTLVDEFGREVGFLAGANGQARLELHSLANRSSAIVAAEGEASVQLESVNKDRVRLLNKGDLSALEIRNDQGKLRILIGVSDTGKPKVMLRGADEEMIWQAPPENVDTENEDKL